MAEQDIRTAPILMLPEEVQATELLRRVEEAQHPEIAQREEEFAMVREIALKQAAQIARELPIPKEAGPHWHWMSFACNRIADEIMKLLPKN